MRLQRERDTYPERLLRSRLYQKGLRFRVHRALVKNSRREADIVFSGARVAVFVDGCFWHGCPDHATWPVTNGTFWRAKIERNRDRDLATAALLSADGWLVIRVWEHEDAVAAAERVAAAVRARHGRYRITRAAREKPESEQGAGR